MQKIFVGVLCVVLFPGVLGINLLGLDKFFERLEIAVPGIAVLFFGIFGAVVSLGGFLWVSLRMWKSDRKD